LLLLTIFTSPEPPPILRAAQAWVFSFHNFDFAPAKNFIKKKPPRPPLNFSASQRRQKIAGLRSKNKSSPGRGERKSAGNMRAIICRPSGTRFILFVEPTVETVGYFLPSLRDFSHRLCCVRQFSETPNCAGRKPALPFQLE
jgi:hypothetical protein